MPYPLAAIRGHSVVASGVVAPNTYSISGLVLDSDGATGVSGSAVALGAYSAISGVTGAYVISGIPAGTSGSLTCTKTGYSWTAISVAAMSGNLTAQNFTNAWWASGGIAASCVAAYKPKGAANLAASYINLANPGTYNAAPGVAPTFAGATGWTFDGATQYLDCGFVPAGDSSWSFFMQFSDGASTGYHICGITTGIKIYIDTTNNANGVFMQNGSNGKNRAPVMTAGNYGFAGLNAYRNGSLDSTANTAGGGSNALPFFIGARNNSGSADVFWVGNILAACAYNATLSTQIAGLAAAMAAL